MSTTQSACVLHGPKDLRLESRAVWPPKAGEVQVKILSVGLCGSDLHYYTHARNGDFALRAPFVLGHEAVGVVTAIGPPPEQSAPHVQTRMNGSLSVGQRVVLEPGIYCGTCSFCSRGRYNLCKDMAFCSSAKTFPHLDGMLVESMNHPRGLLWPIPDELPTPLAALAEPLSVLLHAASRGRLVTSFAEAFAQSLTTKASCITDKLASMVSNPNTEKCVLVFGVGTIGILACALAKHLGARKVCAIDIDQKRLEFAKENGWVDDIWCLQRPAPSPPPATLQEEKQASVKRAKESITPALARFGEPDGFDVVFECTGVEPCIQMGVFAALPTAPLLLIGMGSPIVTLPISAAATREVDLIGSFRYAGTWSEAVDLLAASASGEIGKGLGPIEKVLTHRILSLNDCSRAFELMAKGRDENDQPVLKVLVGEGSGSV